MPRQSDARSLVALVRPVTSGAFDGRLQDNFLMRLGQRAKGIRKRFSHARHRIGLLALIEGGLCTISRLRTLDHPSPA